MSSEHSVPHIRSAGDGERIWIQGNTVTFKATAETTAGMLSLTEIDAAPGCGPPLHVHEREDEWFYVLEGAFRITLGDRLVDASAGDFAFVPRGTPHCFVNTGSSAGRMLAGFTPGGIEGFFRAAGTPASGTDAAPPPAPVGEQFKAAAAEHGMHVV